MEEPQCAAVNYDETRRTGVGVSYRGRVLKTRDVNSPNDGRTHRGRSEFSVLPPRYKIEARCPLSVSRQSR